MNKLNSFFNNKFLLTGIFIYFFGIFSLSRTFMGIYILGFRIGELSMLFSLILFIFGMLQFNSEIFKKNLDLSFFIASHLLLISFIIFVFFNGSFTNLYSYKSSTYIWSIGYLFFGIVFSKFVDIKIKYLFPFLLLLIFLYLYSIYGISDDLQMFLLRYADKFEYHKGSDLVIMFTAIFYLINRIYKNKNRAFELFIIFSALYAPLMIFKSRSGFAAFLIFLIFEFLYLKKNILFNSKRLTYLLILCLGILLQSLFIVNKNGLIDIEEIPQNVDILVDKRKVALNVKGIEVKKPFLFIENNRLYSGDGNLNWRIQIWQDVVSDLNKEGKIFTGFNFNQKFDAMDDPFRSGNDGTNENVHNFLINVFGRGGLIHLFLYLYLFFSLLKKLKHKHNFYYLGFPISIILTSLFDASMENSHFPLIFYFVLGVILNLKKNKEI